MKYKAFSESGSKNLVIRTDASRSIGAGHLIRCLVLADTFTDAGWNCAFACRPGTGESLPFHNGFPYELFEMDCDPREEPSILRRKWLGGCDLLIVDHYSLDKAFESACRKWAKGILVIDDLADRAHNCDFLLDSAVGRTEKDYQSFVPERCQFFLGPAYALLRSEFFRFRNHAIRRREKIDEVHRILLLFGAMDNKNLCSKTLTALKRIVRPVSVEVVTSSAAPYLREVEDIAGHCPFPVTIHKDAENIAEIMAESDLAVGAGGMSCLERCSLGLPSIVIITADNQRYGARALEESGAVEVAGWHDDVTPEGLCRGLQTLLDDPEKRLGMSRRAIKICDGRGSLRLFIDLLPSRRLPDGREVRLRLASLCDIDLIYAWQSSPQTRRFFRNPQMPEYEEHSAWMKSTLNDPERILMVILCDDKPSGQIRLDKRSNNSYEVSIITAPEMRRNGIGKAALEHIATVFPKAGFCAEVMPGNDMSSNLFLSAGFVRMEEGWYFRGSNPEDSNSPGI
jgi:UDP-2,4-diacetamido-2,4,6-trideoxy-beta-L-altropyranose hydrolase